MNRTTRQTLIACAAALLLTPLASIKAADPPALKGSFPLGVYWPWEAHGWTGQTERAGEVGLRRAVSGQPQVAGVRRGVGGEPGDCRPARPGSAHDGPGNEAGARAGRTALQPRLAAEQLDLFGEGVEAPLKAAGGSPAILAWALCDEPGRDLVGEMETFRRKFIEWGARQPAVVVTMWPDSPVYAEQAGFGAVCTDVYPFFSAGNPNGPNTPAMSRSWYRRHAQIAAQAARKAGRTPWIMPQCFVDIWGPWKYDEHLDAVMLPGAFLHWRQPSVGEARWQVWSAIGAGVRGFFWYVYLPPPADQPEAKPYVGPAFPPALAAKQPTSVHAPGGLLRPNGDATPECLAVAGAFAALKRLLPLLKGAVPVDPPFGEVSPPGWIGGLTNPGLNRTFAVVVNDDTDRGQTLKIHSLRSYDVRDLCTDQVLKRAADNTVAVKLGPGDGTLLEEISQKGRL